MKRNRLSMLGAGFALALAGFTGSAQAAQSLTATVQNEIKAKPAKHTQTYTIHNTVGGIPLTTFLPDYGMSPKEYGMRFGHGNRKGKSNRLRYSHNAKMKRRA
ncbi:hypothetical protein [Pedobacter gandavensis]|uniref:Glycosyl hydrolase family 92 N-terminal domain-containing protein n=1 Tax=Pedobacter gandavensis TaxID=2679963 RepID=A0ABR6EU74_9SPHI|nr:hypothetical protein [Pedobacter gandavensis]MBB2148817.1 hypothetical protein [Pedobacter gandavensis]